MHSTEAARFLEALALRPGYELIAVPMGAEELFLLITIETTNSNESHAPHYRQSFKRPCDPVKISTAGKDAHALVGDVLRVIAEIDMHEHREFTRYRDPASRRWLAPFHPHRPEGEAAMERYRPLAGARSI